MHAARSRRARDDSSPWNLLRWVVCEAVGDEAQADSLVYDAITTSDAAAVPSALAEVLAFAGTHVFPKLVRAIGERASGLAMERFEIELRTHGHAGRSQSDVHTLQSPPPPPAVSGHEDRPLILLVGTDPVGRAWLARALVRRGIDVRSCDSVADLAELLDSRVPLCLAIVAAEHPDARAMLPMLATAFPGLAIYDTREASADLVGKLVDLARRDARRA